MSVQVLETIFPGQAIDPALKLLIDQQGIKPVTDLDKLSSLWPANDDPDELLTFILTERNQRNLVAERKSEGE